MNADGNGRDGLLASDVDKFYYGSSQIPDSRTKSVLLESKKSKEPNSSSANIEIDEMPLLTLSRLKYRTC